jgi:Domain of unknown function (DUF4333)
VIVMIVPVLASCSAVASRLPGQQASLDTAGLAAAVQEVVGVPVTVTCPEDIRLQSGAVTECTVSDGSMRKILIVTQVDDQGTLDWEISERDAPTD